MRPYAKKCECPNHRRNSHLHIGIDLVDKAPLNLTHTHTHLTRGAPSFSWLSFFQKLYMFTVVFVPMWRHSVAHLLRELMGVEDAGDGHLQLVFLLLGLPQRRLPLLQEQVCGVLASKLLDRE